MSAAKAVLGEMEMIFLDSFFTLSTDDNNLIMSKRSARLSVRLVCETCGTFSSSRECRGRYL